ncbi:MAG TPA: AAA family ATPase [Sporosarcina sp.]|nr:AAA family ATPase [Sporosarcina sp.]
MTKAQPIKDQLAVNLAQLRHDVDAATFEFETTEQLPKLEGIVGQTRGKTVMEFGLNIHQQGYHIYVSGISGTGKMSFTQSLVREHARNDVTLYDWCYVHNFEDAYKPTVLQLPVGKGRAFQKDMDQFIQQLEKDLVIAFNDDYYQKEKTTILHAFKEEQSRIYEEINEMAKSHQFMIRQTNNGFVTIPMVDGEPLNEEQYHALSNEVLKEIDQRSTTLQAKIAEHTNELQRIEEDTKHKIIELDKKMVSNAVEVHMRQLRKAYETSEGVMTYLQAVQEDMVEHADQFLVEEEEETLGELLQGRQHEDVYQKYEVNLFIDNRQTEGAPVVIADNCTYYNLIGKVEYESRMGVMSTDFTKIKPGFLHEANGGYIVIQAKDIFTKNFAWEGLKRALLNQELHIENLGEHSGLVATTSIKPEAIPLHVKVVLIGNMDLYQMLYHHDEDFRKLFKIRADFDVEMDFSEDHMMKLAQFIHTHCQRHGLRHFDKYAVARVVEYSMRLAGHQQKMSTRFNRLVEIIYEADTWASMEKVDVVQMEHVERAITERAYRSGLFEEKIHERIADGTVLIDTKGAVIGQVNGLSVYHLGEYQFGKPSRITATTFIGKTGIINIERESEMDGNIHRKGVYILGGFLGERFAQRHPLALTAHLAFEQSYGGIDGDSASSTELYALLSSLAKLPIKQGLAVTGSVNQKGDIQPIGGVNEKIEGFYEVCKTQGLTGEQGVLIPHQNIANLMLKEEVVQAIREGEFSVYAIRTIEEGIELLTGVEAGTIEKEASVYGKVAATLKRYAQEAFHQQHKA